MPTKNPGRRTKETGTVATTPRWNPNGTSHGTTPHGSAETLVVSTGGKANQREKKGSTGPRARAEARDGGKEAKAKEAIGTRAPT
eukprot:7860813-Heterocapsa_arctica.AAC.1